MPTFNPLWWDDSPPRDADRVDMPSSSDVVVVGAGYTGLSAALTLARCGRVVHVFDAGAPGAGASTVNGGIASGNLRPRFSTLVKRFGQERALSIYAEAAAARADLAAFIQEEKIACGYELCGRFTGAVAPTHYDHLSRDVDFLNKHLDIRAYMVSRAEQHVEIGSDFYHGGAIRPDIGVLHPAQFHRGMMDAATRAGAVVHGSTPVSGIRRENDGFQVLTRRGAVKARDVIVCTNAYTDVGLPWLRRRLVPVASQVIATEQLDKHLVSRILPRGRALGETKKMSHYSRLSPDGTRILFGGRVYERPVRGAPLSHQRLYRDLIEIFPNLHGVRISHSWWGFVAFPVDQLPQLIRHDGVHYAVGFCGSGVVWARWFGMKAAYRVMGDAKGRSAFADRVFRALPLYSGKPWFLPAVQAWFGLRDKYGF